MENYNHILNSNWFWCICGILGGGGLSLIISYYFHYISLKEKCISYRIETSPIRIDTKKQILNFKINFKKSKIYSSNIIIRNVGNMDIEKNDIVPNCPITISAKRIITYKIISNHYSNVTSTINYDVEENDKIVDNFSLNLDYLAKNDTINCSCLHTGEIYAYALLKNGSFFESYVITKCGRWYVKLTNFITLFSIIFFIFLTTLSIIVIIPELIK